MSTPTVLFVEDCCDSLCTITCADLATISIDCLSDVDLTGIQDGDTLVYSGGSFIASAPQPLENHIQVLDTFGIYQFDAYLL